MKLVYIAGPFSPTPSQLRCRVESHYSEYYKDPAGALRRDCIRENVLCATRLAVRVAASGDYLPVCPHSNTGGDDFLEDFLALHDPSWWYAATLELLRRCDAIALVDGWEESNGACREVIEASEQGLERWVDGHISWIPATLRHEAIAALRSRGETP